MIHKCAKCHKKVASWHGDERPPRVAKGVRLTLREGEAPRLRCSCGQVLILLRGEV